MVVYSWLIIQEGAANGDLATQLENGLAKKTPRRTCSRASPPDTKAEASRVSGYKVIQNIADIVPTYISGGADLHDSTRNYIDGGGD
ncbi:hypothetical protein ScalyP_jg11351, partial [Parmales sp. scaly parma]